MNELYLRIEAFQNLLIDIATSGAHSDAEYKAQRSELMMIEEIKDLLPQFLQTNRSASQFWQFMKGKFQTYKERREFLWHEFSSALAYAENRWVGIAETSISQKIEKFNLKQIDDEWRKALKRSVDDPEGAITSARTLVETTCKYVLDNTSAEYQDDLELPKLFKLTASGLNLAPDQHTEQIFKQILRGIQTVVEGLGAMRNKLSDSHGKKSVHAKPATRHAELAVNLAGTLTTFLLATFEAKILKKKPL